MSHAFLTDAMKLSNRRNMRWYQNNLMHCLEMAKEKHTREIDFTIEEAKKLIAILEEKVDLPIEVPMRHVVESEDDSFMRPIEPELLDAFYNSTEKGGDVRYLKERNKKSPEDKFFFRTVTSWDYGWLQKQSRQLNRDVNFSRCAILRDTFYRRNNAGPDPPHYAQPAGAEVSVCSEYSCNAN